MTDDLNVLDRDRIAALVMALCAGRGPDRSICPSVVARRMTGDDGDWRRLMPDVRAVAHELAAAGHIEITRRGVPVQPGVGRGPVRLRIARVGGTSGRRT
jgi:hypothetical protein